MKRMPFQFGLFPSNAVTAARVSCHFGVTHLNCSLQDSVSPRCSHEILLNPHKSLSRDFLFLEFYVESAVKTLGQDRFSILPSVAKQIE